MRLYERAEAAVIARAMQETDVEAIASYPLIAVGSDGSSLSASGVLSVGKPHPRSYGTFVRSFQLPQTIDEGGIEASFDHGVLTVRVPKAQRPQPKKLMPTWSRAESRPAPSPRARSRRAAGGRSRRA